MNKFVVLVLPDETKAYRAVEELRELHKEGNVTVYGTVVVQRDANGAMSVKEREEEPFGLGVGTLAGGLIGLFGGPAGVAAGIAVGGLAGGWRDLLHAEVSDEFLEQVQRDLTPGNFAVIAEISEEWTAPVDSRMQALGATVVRASRDAYVDDLIAKRAETSRSEFAEWKTKRSGAKAERMEAKLDEEIEGAKQKLQRTAEKARERIDHTKEEMEAKLTALQDQAAKANPEVKARVQQRIADLRRDFEERERKLSQAYELTQQALQA